MAAGDFLIYRNDSETTVLPNAGSNLDTTWDTEVTDIGGTITYSAGNFQLDTGKYLVMYSEKFDTTDVTNNERIEIQGEIHESGVGAVGGWSQDFIRKSSGQQEAIVSGYMILDVTSDNTDYFIRFYRTDDSTTGTVNRVPGTGGVQILELDSTDNFGLYSTSATEATATTAIRTLNINTNDQQDTGFSRSGDIVTVTNAGRYLMTYSLDVSQTATGREDVVGFIERNSTTAVPGSYSFCYLRGSDGTQDGAITWIGLVDVNANDTFRVRWSSPTSATITAAAGATFQMWQIPSGNDTAIMEATTGDYNTSGQFAFDTLPHIDTASFTATAGNSNIDVDQQDFVLSFATFHQDAPDTPQRAYPEVRLRVGGTNVNYTGGGMYHRNSGGSGVTAVTVAGIVSTNVGSSVEVNITPVAASGTLNNDSAQFALLSLESIYGPYDFPPSISDVDSDDIVGNSQTNVNINGVSFGSVQGTGTVVLAENPDGSGTSVTQTINSWSDTLINIDISSGALADSYSYMRVTSDASVSGGRLIQVGLPPITYTEAVEALSPDHYWILNNSYAEEVVALDWTVASGSPVFVTEPLTRGRTHSWRVSSTGQEAGPANSNNMNGAALSTRSMGGWIRISQIQDSFVMFYEEGGGINNIAFFMGIGGILIAQLADTGDDNVHAYSDFPLEPDRNYHVMFRFDYTQSNAADRRFELFVDGVLQSSTFGNPLTSAGGHLDSHTGDIEFGDSGDSLEVFGTDINFPSAPTTYYQDWATWTTYLTQTEIREELFEQGVRGDITISSGTEAAMQTALDAYADTVQPNSDCTFVINDCTDGDFELDFDNIVFNSGTSIQVQYKGDDTLTANNLNGSNLESAKISTPLGGTVTIVTPSTLTITNLQNPTEVRVYTAGTQTEVAGEESVTSGTFSTSITVSSVDIVFISLGYQILKLTSVDTSSDTSFPVNQLIDRQYENV